MDDRMRLARRARCGLAPLRVPERTVAVAARVTEVSPHVPCWGLHIVTRPRLDCRDERVGERAGTIPLPGDVVVGGLLCVLPEEPDTQPIRRPPQLFVQRADHGHVSKAEPFLAEVVV